MPHTKQIEFQAMTASNTCMSACVAMLTNTPIAEVIEEFHQNYYYYNAITPEAYMASKGVGHSYESRNPKVPKGTIEHGKVYLLSVPSVNGKNQNHAVILDTRSGEPVVYDPAKGFCEHHIEGMGDSMYELRTWSIDLIVGYPGIRY